jgi:hypothetical protein
MMIIFAGIFRMIYGG